VSLASGVVIADRGLRVWRGAVAGELAAVAVETAEAARTVGGDAVRVLVAGVPVGSVWRARLIAVCACIAVLVFEAVVRARGALAILAYVHLLEEPALIGTVSKDPDVVVLAGPLVASEAQGVAGVNAAAVIEGAIVFGGDAQVLAQWRGCAAPGFTIGVLVTLGTGGEILDALAVAVCVRITVLIRRAEYGARSALGSLAQVNRQVEAAIVCALGLGPLIGRRASPDITQVAIGEAVVDPRPVIHGAFVHGRVAEPFDVAGGGVAVAGLTLVVCDAGSAVGGVALAYAVAMGKRVAVLVGHALHQACFCCLLLLSVADNVVEQSAIIGQTDTCRVILSHG